MHALYLRGVHFVVSVKRQSPTPISVSGVGLQICCNSLRLQKPEHNLVNVRGHNCILQRLACFSCPPQFAACPTRTSDRNVARTTVSCVCSLWHPQCTWEFGILLFEATTQKTSTYRGSSKAIIVCPSNQNAWNTLSFNSRLGR